MKKIILLSVFIFLCIFFLVFFSRNLMETRNLIDIFLRHSYLRQSLESTLIIIQCVGIILGSFWTYITFSLEKKGEKIVRLQFALRDYHDKHCWSAAQYRVEEDENAILNYKLKMIKPFEDLKKVVYAAYYLSQDLKQEIFDAIFSVIKPIDAKEIDLIWGDFDNKMKKIQEKLNKKISFLQQI